MECENCNKNFKKQADIKFIKQWGLCYKCYLEIEDMITKKQYEKAKRIIRKYLGQEKNMHYHKDCIMSIIVRLKKDFSNIEELAQEIIDYSLGGNA